MNRWPAERFAELADLLAGGAGTAIIIGGPEDVPLADEIVSRSRSKPLSVAGKTSLLQLGAVLEKCGAVVSGDTGPLHISVALDRPVVSLIGYSNPKRVGPYRKFRDLMIDAYGDVGEEYPISMENRRDRMARITWNDVLDRVQHWKSTYAHAGS